MNICGNSASHGWGTAGANGAQVTFSASDQTLDGDIVVDTISTLDMTLSDNSTFNGTINIMKVNDRKVINDSCRTERLGVGRCVNNIQNAVMNKFQNIIDESIVTNYLIGKPVTITKEYEELMRICIDEYIVK